MHRKKKAQIEMMGLAVVVVLVAIIMLFYISFSLNKDAAESEPKEEYTDKQMAFDYILALMKTTTDCEDLTVQQLLQDCILYQELECPLGMGACDYAGAIIMNISENSLNKWHREYILEVNHTAYEHSWSTENCTENSPAEATGFYPLTTYPNPGKPMMITLRICKQ